MSSNDKDAKPTEWHQIAYINQDTSLLFLRGVKRYVKFVVEFQSSSSLQDINFLLLVQINIEDIISPVISDHTRNVLDRFPSWSKSFEDSIEKATPELATPMTNSGKFINALLTDHLDKIDEFRSRIEVDSFIDSADRNEIAWMYFYQEVRPGFIKVAGDFVELARVSTIKELLEHRPTDDVFYYNFSSNRLFTLKKYLNLSVDGIKFDPIAIQNLNSFDDFGLKVGLKRLYLESNENFSKRILDVSKNPPSINEEGFKLTLRRELDIWRAFDSTPNSDYLGATPEVIEISDMQLMSKYFTKEGIPTKEFYDFVEYLNVNYPSNYGYIKWNEAYWDYAGKRNEGVSDIGQITDAATVDSYIDIYQPGIGDFDDARLKLEKLENDVNKYSFGLRVKGIKYEGTENAYEPIYVKYDSYLSYFQEYVDNETATVNYDVILKLNLHGNIPANSVYRARYQTKVRNEQDSSASPEFVTIPIFNASGFTTGDSIFYNQGGTPYLNSIDVSATESYTFTQIPLFAVDQATISYVNSLNESGSTSNYGWVGFLDSTPNLVASQSKNTIVKTSQQINDSPRAMMLKVHSEIYTPKKRRELNTPKIRSSHFGNVLNNSSNTEQKSPVVFTPGDILRDIIIPSGATPAYVHIDNVVVDSYDIDHSSASYSGYGGISKNRDTNDVHLIPASPNIIFSFVNPNFSTPEQMPNYAGSSGATANYYFSNIKFPYDATPDRLAISSQDNFIYPFNYLTWEKFSADSVSDIDFYIGPNGVSLHDPNKNYENIDSKNGNLIGRFDFARNYFGLSSYASNTNLWISDIEVINDNDDVQIYTVNKPAEITPITQNSVQTGVYDNSFMDEARWSQLIAENKATPEGLLNFFESSTGQYIVKNVPVYAEYVDRKNKNVSPSINTGWYFFDGEERYIYAKPATYVSEVNATSAVLDGVSRQGAPIIFNEVRNSNGATVEYRQVSFSNEATPTLFSLNNYEYITAKHQNYLALAYDNVFDVTVIDTFTGETVLQNQSYPTNIIDLTSSSTPYIRPDRQYKVTYRVKNSYIVDNEYYSTIDNSYKTSIQMLTTPNYDWKFNVTYESSVSDSDYELEEMSLNPLYSPMNSGFVYLSHLEYPLNSLESSLSPRSVSQQTNDFMALNVWSKDINNNPKPNQLIAISGTNSMATPSTVTTNEDGYARAYVYYSGPNSATPFTQYVYLHDESQNFSATSSYRSIPMFTDPNKVSAEVTKKILNADGEETQYIFGNATPNSNSVVYWRKGRTLYEALQEKYSTSTSNPLQSVGAGMTLADQLGNFKIGPFVAQDDATPGYWFVVVDSELNQTTSQNPVTIAGDIVYWYERYDVNQSNSEEPVISPALGDATQYYHYLQNPVFKTDQLTNVIYYEDSATNSWNLPKWYPISRFDQFKSGLLGSTPYQIDSYSNIRPDYEEE